ncbi:MAG: isochorismatase family protein [Candidatus Ancillula sp.]|jgi:nicotinamidase-related amidase|nr:isochorismatase family protein [Candidatus Ancillula sp.]
MKSFLALFLAFAIPFVAVFCFSSVNASGATNASNIIVKDKFNTIVCELSTSNTVCDLADAIAKYNEKLKEERGLDESQSTVSGTTNSKTGAGTSKETTFGDTVNSVKKTELKASGTLTLKKSGGVALSLSAVDAPELVLSLDGSVNISTADSETAGKLARIENIEADSETVFEKGNYILDNTGAAALDVAGKLSVRPGVSLTVSGKNYGVYSGGSLTLESGAKLKATVAVNGGYAIMTQGIMTQSGAEIEAVGVKSETKKNIGIATLGGDNINFNGAKVKVNADIGISTLTTTPHMFGDVFINESDIEISATSGAGIIGKNVYFAQNTRVDITAATDGVGVINGLTVQDSALNINANRGIISNADVTLKNGASASINAVSNGVTVLDDLYLEGTARLDVMPTESSDPAATPREMEGIRTANSASFDVIKPGGASITGRVVNGKGGAFFCGGPVYSYVPDVVFPFGLSSVKKLVVNSAGQVEEQANDKLQPCELNIGQNANLKDGELNVENAAQGDSAAKTIMKDGAVLETMDVAPVEVPFWVELWYRAPAVFVLLLLLLILLIAVIVFKLTHARALVILNLQNDMMETGSLQIQGAHETAELICDFVRQHRRKYRRIYAVAEWHTSNLPHFQNWTRHCVENTEGARFVDNFAEIVREYGIITVKTGQTDDGYQVLAGEVVGRKITLEEDLNNRHINCVDFVGIPLDYSIMKSAIYAVELFAKKRVRILLNLTATISDYTEQVLKKLEEQKVVIK